MQVVMPGLDPGIHRKSLDAGMDCRVKPGNDNLRSFAGYGEKQWIRATCMTKD
jgi:hypothetical protein